MRVFGLVLVLGWALTGCGGRSRHEGQEPADRVSPLEGCFPLGVEVTDARWRAAVALKLGVDVAEGAVDASEPNALARAQQLVDAVEVELERGLPSESRQLLRTFLGELVGEASRNLPPELAEGVQAAMQQELDSFANHWMLGQRGSLESLLTSPTTWLNGELADHYGLAHPGSGAWEPVELPPERRAGLMTLGAMLARFPAPPYRAMHLAEALSCITMPPPPALDSMWDKEPKQTAKSIVEQAYSDDQVSCKSCHTHYIGFAIALDRHDEVGRYRDALNGVAIDTSYSLTMPTFEPQPGDNDGHELAFATPAELGRALSQTGGVRACLVRKLNERLGASELTDSELGCLLEGLQDKQGNLRSVLAMLAPRLATAQ